MYHYYKIADLTVKMNTFGRTADLAFPYRIEPCSQVDITIDPGYQILKAFQPDADDELCEYLASGRVFYRNLIAFDGMMLHASAIAIDGKAYLFSADSGTGKSTHTRLWRELFGDRAIMVNDDMPFLQITSNGVLAYGSPWSGKHGLATNICVPLQGICFLSRGKENVISRAEPASLAVQLHRQAHIPLQEPLAEKALALVQTLAKTVPLWQMQCNTQPESAQVAYRAMGCEQDRAQCL